MRRLFANFKRHLTQILLGLAIVITFVLDATSLQGWELVNRMERIAYDARLLLTMPGSGDDRIVIIDIDEKSLGELGRWPWPRNIMARFMDRLFDDYHVFILGLDVVFAEPDVSSGLPVLEQLASQELRDLPRFQQELNRLRPRLDNDRLFADSMHDRPVVLGYYFNTPAEGGKTTISGVLPPPVFTQQDYPELTANFVTALGYGANLAELQRAAMGGGHFTPDIDLDGVVRRVPLVMKYRDGYYEALSLAIARYVLGVEKIIPNTAVYAGDENRRNLESLQIGDYRIPVDDKATSLIPYRGKKGTYTYVSAADVYYQRVAPEVLDNAIVLLGTTAPGLKDLRSTPVQSVYPGVEIHANLITGILDETILSQPPYVAGIELFLLLAIGLIMSLLLPACNPLWAIVTTLSILAMNIGTNLWFWQQDKLVIPIAHSLFLILILFLLDMVFGYFIEARRKRLITSQFGRYVPPELVNEMSMNPEDYSLEGESREMTVLFADIRSFTTISEGLSPQDLTHLMNDYFTPMTRIIHQHRGTIDKYVGDMVMAFWGAPVDDPEHAQHALQAGLAMLERTRQLHAPFAAKGWPEINIGVGINTGTMNVGNMGSEFRVAYTVLGDAVNLGSRLESLTKQYGVSIIASEFTRARAPEFVYCELDRVRVKGKDKPITIYEPLGSREQLGAETLADIDTFQQVLHHYRAREWEQADSLLAGLQAQDPARRLYSLYRERIASFRLTPPPPDWEGVYTYTSK
jgi:adenylate cyclase